MYRMMVADYDSPSYFVATAAVKLGFFKQEGVDVEEELADRARSPRVDLGLQHLDVVINGRAFRMLLRIGGDGHLEIADRPGVGGRPGEDSGRAGDRRRAAAPLHAPP